MKTKNDTKKLLPKFEAVTLSEADLQQVSGGMPPQDPTRGSKRAPSGEWYGDGAG